MACVTHKTDFDEVLTKDQFVSDEDTLNSRLANIFFKDKTSLASAKLDLFSIIARMLKDPELAPNIKPINSSLKEGETKTIEQAMVPDFPLEEALSKFGEKIKKYAEMWKLDLSSRDDVEKTCEELAWAVVLLYGVGGLQSGKSFQGDFFL